jgi:hypothetical protein
MRANAPKRLLSAVILFTAGCAAEEAHWDSAKLRQHAVNYYTDQIMDNLIRARNGQFFLHVNINNLQSQVISEVAGTVQGGQTLNNTNNRATTDQIVRTNTNTIKTPANEFSRMVAGTLGVVATATNLAVRPFTVSATPRWNDQLTFATVPEVNDPPIYLAYLKFINAETDHPLGEVGKYEPVFGDAVKSVKKKQPGDNLLEGAPGYHDLGAHSHYYVPGTLTKWNDGQIYYIPIAFAKAYFQLCMELSGRITIGPKGKATAAGILPPKNESPEQEQLKRIEQKLNTLPQR